MKAKFEFLLKNKGLNATSLARMLEIQPSGLSHILSGRNKPSFDLVVKILKAFPDVKVTTIARGIGFGDELEYVDELTITHALMNRREVK